MRKVRCSRVSTAVLCSLIAGLALSLHVNAQQTIASGADPLPPGRLVDVGGHRLHLNCTGTRGPTVIMEAGAGDFSVDWSLVQPRVASFAHICTYDRAGYGWSDPGPMPRTMQQIVYELHTALVKAAIKPPFVMVGHSLGGLIVRVYANQYPKEVSGMVLVDSSHEDQKIVIVDRATKKEKVVHWRELSTGRPIPAVQTKMATGDSRTPESQRRSTNKSKLEAPYDRLPLNTQQLRLWAMSQPSYTAARVSEFEYLADELALIYAERGRQEHPLGNKPLIIMTRGILDEDEQANKQLAEDHDRLQRDLLSLSTNSKQIIAAGSGHQIQLYEPDLVTDAIRQVVRSARRK